MPRTLLRIGAGLATAACVVALPLGLVASNVRAVTLDRSFYLAEFARYDRGAFVGLSQNELGMVADAFIAYFQAPPQRMDVRLPRGGTLRPLFNDREVAHMVDVQALMHLVFRVQALALGYVGLYVLGGLVLGRRAFLPLAAKVAAAGAVLTLGIIGVLGALAATDFSDLFVQFHLLSFSNDLWLLDPRTDNLIRLFPQEFFLDAAMRIVVFTVFQALVLGAAGVAGMVAGRRLA
ncbi:MAG TPA: TIGR01906 family membrane protein [Chloroflexota bacterium]